MPEIDEIKSKVKSFILREFLPGEDPEELTESTSLVAGGILDSISTMKLVMFLEENFNVEIQAHETDVEYLDTIEAISQLVLSKAS